MLLAGTDVVPRLHEPQDHIHLAECVLRNIHHVLTEFVFCLVDARCIEEDDLTVFEWMSQWKQEGDDEQAVRSILGRLLFSQDDIKKPAKVLSGGEKGRMLFGKLMMQKPNILIMDEPTNHLDMESIESLNMALELYQGTLIFVSHDREFVSSLATRILEITPERVIDFSGNYEDYLRSKGIDG